MEQEQKERLLRLLAEREATADRIQALGRELAAEATEGMEEWVVRHRHRMAVARNYAAVACLAVVLAPLTVAVIPARQQAHCHQMDLAHAVQSTHQMMENLA